MNQSNIVSTSNKGLIGIGDLTEIRGKLTARTMACKLLFLIMLTSSYGYQGVLQNLTFTREHYKNKMASANSNFYILKIVFFTPTDVLLFSLPLGVNHSRTFHKQSQEEGQH